MSEERDDTPFDLIKLAERINNRVDSIYKQLCAYECSLDFQILEDDDDSKIKIMDLLQAVQTIQEAAEILRPRNLSLRSKQQSLEEQMKCLQQSVDLLKLECVVPNKKDQMQD